MTRLFFFSIIVISLFSSFYPDKAVQVVFKNSSSESFKELHVWIFHKKFDYYNIKPGEMTKEVNVPAIFKTCTVQVITSKDKLSFVPVDHVGEIATTDGKRVILLTIISDTLGRRKLDLR